MSFSKDMIQSIPFYRPGSMPTTVPAEYSIRLSNNETYSIDYTQPQILVSHNEDFSLWKEKDNVSHAFKKFVMVSEELYVIVVINMMMSLCCQKIKILL